LAGAPSAAPDDVIAGINAHATAVARGQFLLRTEVVPGGDTASAPQTVVQEELSFDGVRFRMERTVEHPDEPADSPMKLYTLYWLFDGEKAILDGTAPELLAEVSIPQTLDDLSRHISPPHGLLEFTLMPGAAQAPPLGDAFEAVGVQQDGEEAVGGIACLRFASPTTAAPAGSETNTWWIAPSKGYAVAQHAYKQVVDRPGEEKFTRTVVDSCEHWVEVQGIWLPQVTVRRWYLQKASEAEAVLHSTATTSILSASVNAPVSDEVFSYQPAAGSSS
jgi:hypothetical protein